MARNYMQGKFVPRNPKKYEGNVDLITYRSSWEKTAFMFCDQTPEIVRWSSEETVINYISPLDGEFHRYFVDLKVVVKRPDGSYRTILIEIKPYDQTRPPTKGRKSERTYLTEVQQWAVNSAKWKFAKSYCERHDYDWLIWTEHDLFPTLKKLPRYKKKS